LITEKDTQISAFLKHFEVVKDDFHYNLKILEVRDSEIRRLTEAVSSLRKENASKESEIQSLSSRINMLVENEQKRKEKRVNDNVLNKVLCVMCYDMTEPLIYS
jgi:uncharacterized protein YlxW (UPF0749 family)